MERMFNRFFPLQAEKLCQLNPIYQDGKALLRGMEATDSLATFDQGQKHTVKASSVEMATVDTALQ
eukprot:4417055-Amphidinium_carterae.2